MSLLNETVLNLLADSEKLTAMSEKTASLALSNSSELIADMLKSLT